MPRRLGWAWVFVRWAEKRVKDEGKEKIVLGRLAHTNEREKLDSPIEDGRLLEYMKARL
jgi:hypothetical protein